MCDKVREYINSIDIKPNLVTEEDKDVFEKMLERSELNYDIGYEGTPCIEWKRGCNGDGYSLVWGYGKDNLGHRLAYKFFKEPLGDLLCCHHCDNRKCFSPLHLFKGDHQANSDDKVAKGRDVRHAPKTCCPQGHEYTEDNIYWDNGVKKCKICHKARSKAKRDTNEEYNQKARERAKAHYEANKEAKIAYQKQYALDNTEEVNRKKQEYRERTRAQRNAQQKKYREANKEKIAARDREKYLKRKEKKKASGEA